MVRINVSSTHFGTFNIPSTVPPFKKTKKSVSQTQEPQARLSKKEQLAVKSSLHIYEERKNDAEVSEFIAIGRDQLKELLRDDEESSVNSKNIELVEAVVDKAAYGDYKIEPSLVNMSENIKLSAGGTEVGLEFISIPLTILKMRKLNEEIEKIDEEIKQREEKIENSNSKKEIASLQFQIKKLNDEKSNIEKQQSSSIKSFISSLIKAAGATAAFSNEIKEAMEKSSSIFLSAANEMGLGGTAALSFVTETADLFRNGIYYKELSDLLDEKETKRQNLTNEKEIEIIDAEIKELKEKLASLRGNLLENTTNIASEGMSTVSYASQVLKETSTSHLLSSTLVKALPALIQGSSLATSGAGLILSSKKLVENGNTDIKLKEELQRLTSLKSELDSSLHFLVDMKINNVQAQIDSNLVETVKNSVSLLSSSVGISSGVMSVILATGAVVGAGVSTAATVTGVGAAALAGAALTIGGGYVAYKNRYAIAKMAEEKYNQARELKVRLKVKLTEMEKSSVDKKLDELKTKIYDGHNIKKEELDEIFSERIEELDNLYQTKNEIIDFMISDPTEKIELKEEVRIDFNRNVRSIAIEKTNLALARAKGQSQDIARLSAQTEVLNKVAAAIAGLESQKQEIRDEINKVREEKENHFLASNLSGASYEDVVIFKQRLAKSLENLEERTKIKKLLLSENAAIKNDNLMEAAISYLTSSV